MPSPLHTAMVYFGLADDPRLEAQLRRLRLPAWRVALALCLGLVVAVGVLLLLGVHPG